MIRAILAEIWRRLWQLSVDVTYLATLLIIASDLPLSRDSLIELPMINGCSSCQLNCSSIHRSIHSQNNETSRPIAIDCRNACSSSYMRHGSILIDHMYESIGRGFMHRTYQQFSEDCATDILTVKLSQADVKGPEDEEGIFSVAN